MKIIPNLKFSEYLELDCMSASALKNIAECPAYYIHIKEHGMVETDAMKLGTAIHTWILENPKFNNEYFFFPKCDRRTKAGKETYAMYQEQAGDRILLSEDFKRYTEIRPYNNRKNEVSVTFEIDGVQCKSRFDSLPEGGVEDIKTIADIFKIDRDFYKFKYHIQAGFYAEAYKAAYGEWPEFFRFTFVSTGKFFHVVTREISFEYMEFGRMEVRRLIKLYKECLENDSWPGVYDGEIEMPSWV